MRLRLIGNRAAIRAMLQKYRGSKETLVDYLRRCNVAAVNRK